MIARNFTSIFDESEAFIGKAIKGAAIFRYCKPLIIPSEAGHMEASGLSVG